MSRKELIEKINAESVSEYSQKQPYTWVRLTFAYNGEVYTGVGFSKVNWPDKFDEVFGINLAFNRAVGDIVKQVRKHEKDKELDKVEKLVEFYTSI